MTTNSTIANSITSFTPNTSSSVPNTTAVDTTIVNFSDYLKSLASVTPNPAVMQRVSLAILRQVNAGNVDVVDASNPFVFSLEASVANVSNFITEAQALTRRQYPSAAQTMDDLFYHMSDLDYVGIYANPALSTVSISFDTNELNNSLMLDPTDGAYKLIIPRNSIFVVSGVSFSIQYPIVIRRMPNSSLQAVWLNDVASPLLTLPTNVIDINNSILPNGQAITTINFPVTQYYVQQVFSDLNLLSGFTTNATITDNFYCARVFIRNTAGGWNEINVTQSQSLFDPTTPTALVQVSGKNISVTIPPLYANTMNLAAKVRIDIYQTEGSLAMDLSTFLPTAWSAKWMTLDDSDVSPFYAPIKNIKNILIYSTDVISSGSNGLTFAQVRARVITNSIGKPYVPITNTQLVDTLQDNGFNVVTNVDNVVNRIMLATRNLPVPTDPSIITPASSGVMTLNGTMSQIALAYGVINNGNSITLTSKVLYQNNNGIINALTIDDINYINGLTSASKCSQVTYGNYYYSPFTYVLDASEETFQVRPYYMDNPTIKSRSFIAENSSTGLQVSIGSTYQINIVNGQYVITLDTSSSTSFQNLLDKDIVVQLSFISPTQENRIYINGTQVGKDTSTGERLYQFVIPTSLYIDPDNMLTISGFNNNSAANSVTTPLENTFDITFSTLVAPSSTSYKANEVDLFLVPGSNLQKLYGITHETIDIVFGIYLEYLWAVSRSVVQPTQYQTWQVNVPDTYTENIYDTSSGSPFTITTDSNGKETLSFNLLHKAGDYVLDSNGNITYKHKIGDVVTDAYGNPVPIPGYQANITRLIDLVLIEGQYYFVNQLSATTYRSTIVNTMLSWITENMVSFNQRVLEQSTVFYSPAVTSGQINVYLDNDIVGTMDAAQTVNLTLRVPSTTINDDTLKAALTTSSVSTIYNYFNKNSQVSISEITSALMDVYGEDVFDVTVEMPNFPSGQTVVTIVDGSDHLSFRKRLSISSDVQYYVTEDLNITFIEHK